MARIDRRLAIVGSREYHDYDEFCKIIRFLHKKYNILDEVGEIVSGEADGVDTLARRFAKENGYKFQPYPADWKSLGKKAGPIRNQQIVDRMTHMVALPKQVNGAYSRGTNDSILKAKKSDKRCFIVVVSC